MKLYKWGYFMQLDNIYLTKLQYNRFLDDIREFGNVRNLIYKETDSRMVEYLQERKNLLSKKLEALKKVEVIEDEKIKVEINDYLILDISYKDKKTENMIIHLVQNSANFNKTIPDVLMSSQIGQMLYLKNVGDQFSYTFDSEVVNVTINGKTRLSKYLEDVKKKQKHI